MAGLRAPERLLILWLALGTIELVMHDVGNERRFMFFIPALIAMAATVLAGRREGAPAELAAVPRAACAPCGARGPVRDVCPLGAASRGCSFSTRFARCVRLCGCRRGRRGTAAFYGSWPWVPRWLARQRWGTRAAYVAVVLVCAGDIAQFVQWAAGRTYKNYEASLAIGRALPPGTAVHGKLANGLSLENRIRPVFVGRGFGNYADRKQRDDVRYILTYIEPRVGYEGPVIQDVLDAYPRAPHHHDIRRGGDDGRSRPRGAHRQIRALAGKDRAHD